MRDELLSYATPTPSKDCTPASDEQTDGLQRSNWRLGARTPSRKYAVRMVTGASSTFDAPTEWDVGFWIEIAAERRKVFSALSIPEYIETWMELADESKDNYWIHLGSDDLVCINVTGTAPTVRIYRLKIQPRRNSLSFLWEVIEPPFAHSSKVEILIGGGRHRCNLRLRHSGLCDSRERELYSTIWRRSLDKLQGLLE
jgi:hypothetical protein